MVYRDGEAEHFSRIGVTVFMVDVKGALSGIAAIDAAWQWEFTPTLIDGNPVPVLMTVTVNFTLQ